MRTRTRRTRADAAATADPLVGPRRSSSGGNGGRISTRLLALGPAVRYVAVNQAGTIVEMVQRSPSYNPPETDRMEELIVNPVVLELTRRRGNLDLEGIC